MSDSNNRSDDDDPVVYGVSVFGEGESLDLFLSRGRMLALGSVPAWWFLTIFLVVEEGWHYSFVLGFALPPIVAYGGVRGYRDVRPGMTAAAMALGVATPLATMGLAWLENH
ncbi:hypothetical protein [Streptomyces sp. NPDC057694]|uniref:hypothetical protein n=1 Tax=Streptomyces sp. NPDC057694 TaxID=3346216 RepID=UPI0036D075B5